MNLFARKKRKNLNNKLVVSIGGGSGQFSLLSGLKGYATNKNCIKAIVTTLDNGGSSGKLITQFGILPPGDIRNCILALSDETEVLIELFKYRFNGEFDGHNFGNLFLTALTQVTGSFEEAIRQTSRILNIKGEVIPVSLELNNIIARLEDGRELVGETLIDTTKNKKIERIYLEKDLGSNPRAAEVLRKADVIVFGPGDLYTSIIPNLLFKEIRDAIRDNKKAKKVMISAVMSKPGETDDFCVSDLKRELEKYMKSSLTHIIANTHVPASTALAKYREEGKHPVPLDVNRIRDCKIIRGNFIDEDELVRHNPQKLARAIIDLVE